MVEAATARSSELIASLCNVDRVPAIAPLHRARRAALTFDDRGSVAPLHALGPENHRSEPRSRGLISEPRVASATEGDWLGDSLHEPEVLDLASEADVPSEIDARAERRVVREVKTHWARLAMERFGNLVSQVQRGGNTWNPWLGDLSRGGARLCFDGPAPAFELGSLVRVVLRMQQCDFSHTAMVVRTTTDSIGCSFQPLTDNSVRSVQLATLLTLLDRQQHVY